MFLFSSTHKAGRNNTACRLSFCPIGKKKHHHSRKRRSISCLCALRIGERRRGGGGRGEGVCVGGGQWLWHYVAWKIFSCLIYETQSPPWVTMVATFSHLWITLYYAVCVCVQWKTMDSLTNHLWACLLYALSFLIRLYGKRRLLTAHAAQLFCLPPHFACSLSFFFCIDSETQSGSFACLVMPYKLLCVCILLVCLVRAAKAIRRRQLEGKFAGNLQMQLLWKVWIKVKKMHFERGALLSAV